MRDSAVLLLSLLQVEVWSESRFQYKVSFSGSPEKRVPSPKANSDHFSLWGRHPMNVNYRRNKSKKSDGKQRDCSLFIQNQSGWCDSRDGSLHGN